MGLLNRHQKTAISDLINESADGFASSYTTVNETVDIDTTVIAESVAKSNRIQNIIREAVTDTMHRALSAAIVKELAVTLRENAADYSADDVSWAQECVEGAMTELVDDTQEKVVETIEGYVTEAVNMLLTALADEEA